MPTPRSAAIWLALLALLLQGCAAGRPTTDLGALYSRAAMEGGDQRNPVVVIPGILGSRLTDKDSGTLVWGAFTPGFADPTTPAGARLVGIPMREGEPLHQLRDSVRPAGALDTLTVNVLGIPVQLDAYAQILQTLGVGGYRDQQLGRAGAIDYGSDHYTCFQFDYDWRLSTDQNAALLGQYIEESVIPAVPPRADGSPVRVDVVAHSMGGMLLRYYLMYGRTLLPDDGSLPPLTWAGSEHVDHIIILGTPNAGSALAITQLVDGWQPAPIIPRYEPAVLGTMPAVYQLMPRDRHGPLVDDQTGQRLGGLYDPAEWERREWGLADPKQDRVLQLLLPDQPDPAARRRIALDHLRKCLARAEQLHRALDVAAAPPTRTRLNLIAGDAAQTPAVLSVDSRNRLRLRSTTLGDGTVTRASALMDERLDGDWTPRLRTPIAWDSVLFLFQDHIGLTRDEEFTDNVLYLLLEQPRSTPTPPTPTASLP